MAQPMTPTSADIVALEALRRAGDAGYIEPTLHVTIGGVDEGLTLQRARCSCRESGFEHRELTPGPKLVFVESGGFRRRTPGSDALVDVGFAYFASPGSTEEFAHLTDIGDVCTVMRIMPVLLGEITGGDLTLPERPVAIDAEAYRCLRRIVTDAKHGGGEWVEHGINLFGTLIRATGAFSVARRRSTTAAAHRRLVDGAREALVADPSLGVTNLARLLGCSPFHLSRIFRRETTKTISVHRLQLRVREAVARVSAGEDNLARLASELGFSDHSHLTRLLVRELGETPTAIRRAERKP
jgi:AraC-like DNA-binding protein